MVIRKKFPCKHCGKKFRTNLSRNGHSAMCKLNPARQQRLKRMSQTKLNNPQPQRLAPRKWYTFNCRKCGQQYTLQLTQAKYKSNLYAHYCSISCRQSRVFDQHRKLIQSKALKTSRAVKLFAKRRIQQNKLMKQIQKDNALRICPICGYEFTPKTESQVYCTNTCLTHARYNDRKLHQYQQKVKINAVNRVSLSGWGKSGY